MNVQLLFIMGISLLLIMPVVGYIVHIIDQKDRKEHNNGAYILAKKSNHYPMYQAYLFLSHFPLTKGYIDKIRRKYEILCPSEPKVIARKTMGVALFTWGLCTAAVIIIFLFKPNIYNGIMAVILVFVINNEVINYQVSKEELKLLEQLVSFLSNVRHNYHINRMVDDAILSSMDGISDEMKIHATKIYDIVTSNEIKENVMKYNATTHNKYLKMFLSLCTSLLDFSDKKVNGQLLFTANIENLKREVNIEILKRKKLRFVFSGTVFVTIAVCIPIDAIQQFGLSIVPSLETFYKGREGIIFVTIIYLTAIIVYILNNKLKETKRFIPINYRYLEKLERMKFIKKSLDNYSEKNYGKMLVMKDTLTRVGETISPRQLLLQRMLLSILVFILSILLCVIMHLSNQHQITHKVNNVETLANSSNIRNVELMEDTILRFVQQYKNKEVSEEFLLKTLTNEKIFYNTLINQKIAQEVILRINKYQSEFFQWYELIACIIVSLIAFFVPFWMVLYKKKILMLQMEDEVNQFNSIIYMMMYTDHMTVKDLLEQLELFAMVFKQSIKECMNDYNSGDIEALIRLKEKEKFDPFQRLVDNLIRCDTISIEKAFDEIASDRENYYDRRKQENEISVQKRADTAKTLSWIPAIFVTIYLLFPILAASLIELEGFRESLSMLGF